LNQPSSFLSLAMTLITATDKSIFLRARRVQPGTILGLVTLVALLSFGRTTLAAAAPTPRNTHFQPGQPWLDTQGTHLNAHGFGIVDFGGRHYWYGAHKIAGKTESEKNEAGVRCYVSDDLLNWQDTGPVSYTHLTLPTKP
jgi:hypothetical protein